MYRLELIYFIVLTIIILFSQFLPTELLLPLDNFIVRIGIVILLLYLIGVGPTAGIVGFVAISCMYLERNRRKMSIANQKLDAMDVNYLKQATVEEASQAQKTVPVNDFDNPTEKVSDYLPHQTCDSGTFEPVAQSIDEKAVLSTIYPLHNHSAAGSNRLYEELGFGHIKGLETVGDS